MKATQCLVCGSSVIVAATVGNPKALFDAEPSMRGNWFVGSDGLMHRRPSVGEPRAALYGVHVCILPTVTRVQATTPPRAVP